METLLAKTANHIYCKTSCSGNILNRTSWIFFINLKFPYPQCPPPQIPSKTFPQKRTEFSEATTFLRTPLEGGFLLNEVHLLLKAIKILISFRKAKIVFQADLTRYLLMFQFDTPLKTPINTWKHHKTFGLLTFSGSIKWKHWSEICWDRSYCHSIPT